MGDPTKGQGSTQKLPKHHSFASQTQDSIGGGGSKPYQSGRNAKGVDSGRDRSKSKGEKYATMPAAQPKKQTF